MQGQYIKDNIWNLPLVVRVKDRPPAWGGVGVPFFGTGPGLGAFPTLEFTTPLL